MRVRWRPARMSLATKSRVLFGASAVMIIGAALFVPFKRMEDLTSELNLSAGRALARVEVARHVVDSQPPRGATRPTTMTATMTVTMRVTPQPARLDYGGQVLDAPRLWSAATLATMPVGRFERDGLDRFARRVERADYSRLDASPNGAIFRYAEPLRPTAECVRCHAAPASRPIVTGRSAATAGVQAALLDPTLFGVVSVEIPNQVQPWQPVLNRVILTAAGLLSGLMAILILSFVISRLILRPVRVLQETAEKVSGGDLNIRSTINTGDEFQRLSETFNTMLINLKSGADQLKAANSSLDMKLVKLAESNADLNEANRLKNEFLANVSHELRTPLNSILGFAELLRTVPATATDAKVARYVSNIMTSGESLLDLINDLLDIAKIEAGRMEAKPSDLSVSDMIEGLLSLLRPLALKKKLTFVSRISPAIPIVHTDPARLQQVLYNLLSNAIKFSPAGGAIDVDAAMRGETHVEIRVTDRGPGIAPGDQRVIFEKFRQVDAGMTRQHGGTGLGLSISSELIRLLQGTIGVDSTLGHGATFWCALPIRYRDDGDAS